MAKKPLIIGLTGGIGSGKSTVAEQFAALGIVSVDADQASRAVVEPGMPALDYIEEHFGPELITADGQLNRPALREIIFADPSEKAWLEALLHPLIRDWIMVQLHHYPVANQRVQQSFQPGFFAGVSKDNLSQSWTIKLAISRNKLRTKVLLYIVQSGHTGFHHSAGCLICIYRDNAQSCKLLGHSTFATANTASKTNNEGFFCHCSSLSCSRMKGLLEIKKAQITR